MKLIGAGLPRTATTTQMIALEKLGFRCYHMRDFMTNMDNHLPLWAEALHGDADWDALFHGCAAAVDWPAAFFFEELMEFYPDAKILLSVRDHESWERSFSATIGQIRSGHGLMHHLAQARAEVDPTYRAFFALTSRMLWLEGAPFAGCDGRRQMIDAAARWDAHVKATVPADRLVIWQPGDGWEPICDALGVPVPNEPLPNVNDTEEFKAGIIGGAMDTLNTWYVATGGARAHGFNDPSARHA